MEKYSYQPLTSLRNTRVLILQPHNERVAPLHCTLKELSFDVRNKAQPRYKALSYVWGAKLEKRPLLCDNRMIFITPNCESALRYLRHKKNSVTLWVDAVCIDQDNWDERAHQVDMMGDIYRRACEVVIWLGEGSKTISKCVSRMWISSRMLQWSWANGSLSRGRTKAILKITSFSIGNMLPNLRQFQLSQF
jgi:hypothetical protein